MPPRPGPTSQAPIFSQEAIRLGRLLLDLLPEPEAMELLALMLLHESRRRARATPQGDLIQLEPECRFLEKRLQEL
jgi:RNA polymerase sigma-70 factor (ECF subfamily)